MRHDAVLDPRHIGAWRQELGWIGGATPRLAVHVAAPEGDITELMEDLMGVMATGGAAAAAIPALISTNDHHLFTPNGKGTEQPIDRCSQTADGRFEFCASAVGTTFQVKDANGGYVDPSACVQQGQLP